MLHNIKIDLLENINLLNNIAEKGNISFPESLSLFLANEFNLKSVALYREDSKPKNRFTVLGKSSGTSSYSLSRQISLVDYDAFIDSDKYEHNYYGEYNIVSEQINRNLQCFVFRIEQEIYTLILNHKIEPSKEDKEKFFNSIGFVIALVKRWKNVNVNDKLNMEIQSEDFLLSLSNGFIKEIETMSGLLTLLKEENISNSALNYYDEVKQINNYLRKSINDFSDLIKFDKSAINQNKTITNLELFSNTIISQLNPDKIKISCDKNESSFTEFSINQQVLEYIILNSIILISSLSKSKELNFSTKINSVNKLQFCISTNANLNESKSIDELFKPFSNSKFNKSQSGLALATLQKYIEYLNGDIKLYEEENNISLLISIPTLININDNIEEIIDSRKQIEKDKVLVIESDNNSSSLLRNYLSKWDYYTEIVNSGNYALQLINKNQYIAVILNIDQENENSLELLQKIKNNSKTRNTPVIVFSLEPKTEKIYLMGAVDYLVKPINYNYLIEILTSYKLRRKSTILCVDDDQPTLNLLKQAVNTAGFKSITEYRPELVMDLIKDKSLDLAIIDLDMPKLNGFDLIKQIKSNKNFAKLPIIIYTGKDDYQEDLQNIDGLFIDLLEKKSTSFNELESTILSMIKSYEEPNKSETIKAYSSGPTILMAEDYKHSQIIVTRLLKKSGFENIIVVENGLEALNICEKSKIDLVLMDMQMPVMNGFEATGKIRELENYNDTPIIALTAFAMKGDREKCLEAGATDYIAKPIDSKEFIEKVKYYTQQCLVN